MTAVGAPKLSVPPPILSLVGIQKRGSETLGKSADVDLDRATKKAWRRFRQGLAERISGLEPDEFIGVVVETAAGDTGAECAPYVQILRAGADEVIGEVSGNHYLSQAHRLSKDDRRRLVEIGWSRPTPKAGLFNFRVEVDLSYADQVAAMTVSALREVFGVPHPAFLVSDVGIDEDPDLPSVDTDAQADEPLAVMPDGLEHLDQLVDQALVPFLGQVPKRDPDGDIPIICGTAVVFVQVLPHAPIIRIWAELVVQITDLDRARFEVAVLNRDRPFAKFVLIGDKVVGQVHLPAAPFAPAHLRETLSMMCNLAEEVDTDLAIRVSGRRFLEPSELLEQERGDEDDEIHPAMLTLLELDAERPGSVKASVAAHVCDYDPQLLLTLIRWNEEQEMSWRSSREEALRVGDPDDEAAVCKHEAAHAKRTVKLLRKALRIVVTESSR